MTYDPLDTGPTDNNADDVLESLTTGTLNTADVSAATEGHALTKAASRDNLEFEAVGGGGTTFIESQSPSGVSEVDFTSSFGSHQAHVFYLHNVIPATDNQVLFVRTSTDAGANWDSGASDYNHHRTETRTDSTTSLVGSSGDAEIQTTAGVGSAAGEDGVSGTVAMYGTGLAKETRMTFNVWFTDDGGVDTECHGGGARLASEDVTGVRFLFSSGNIESGTIEHLGVN